MVLFYATRISVVDPDPWIRIDFGRLDTQKKEKKGNVPYVLNVLSGSLGLRIKILQIFYMIVSNCKIVLFGIKSLVSDPH